MIRIIKVVRRQVGYRCIPGYIKSFVECVAKPTVLITTKIPNAMVIKQIRNDLPRTIRAAVINNHEFPSIICLMNKAAYSPSYERTLIVGRHYNRYFRFLFHIAKIKINSQKVWCKKRKKKN